MLSFSHVEQAAARWRNTGHPTQSGRDERRVAEGYLPVGRSGTMAGRFWPAAPTNNSSRAVDELCTPTGRASGRAGSLTLRSCRRLHVDRVAQPPQL
ncbi:hypothetical protein TYRP_016881 [Tyrophagus putrescentiae]|nr:hypothetical protein TYRP_016881 [Tyrophagus putrescentiae]